MPRTRDRHSSPPAAAQEMDGDTAQPLQFDEAITWRAGRPIAVGELLRRLRALSEELCGLEQEAADRATLVPKAQELVHAQLMEHRDKGVKALVMVCIVEMVRLLAPDAPYKGGQLRQIFTYFIAAVVPALANPTDPYHAHYTAVLVSLNTVKSIILLTDIPSSDGLIVDLFTNCFDVMSGTAKGATGERLPRNLEHHMTGMLCTLVDETDSLPSGVIEIILAQFLRADPNAVLSGSKQGPAKTADVVLEPSPAYNMARAICNTCADRIARANALYFSSVLVDATQATGSRNAVKGSNAKSLKGKRRANDNSDDEEDDAPAADQDLREAEKAHRLLRELWRAAPDITRNVVPQMEAELRTENTQLREMAVRTVGDMVAGIGAGGLPPSTAMDPIAYPSQSVVLEQSTQQSNVLLEPNAPLAFPTAYPAAYEALIDRCKDKDWRVRAAFATGTGRIILTSAGGKGLNQDQQAQLLQFLSDLLNDLDERVRMAAIQVVATFDYHSVIEKLGAHGSADAPGSVLYSLADRVKDRKHHVRVAAMEFLGRLWGVASGAIGEGDEHVHGLLRSIPSRILDAIYINEQQLNALIHDVLFTMLLPVSFPPVKNKAQSSQREADSQKGTITAAEADAIRARRILVLVRDLDEDKAKKVFFAFQNRQPGIAKLLEAYLQACEAQKAPDAEGKAGKKQLDVLVEHLSKNFTFDAELAAEHLKKFAKSQNRRNYVLIRFCYSPESDYRKVALSMKELAKNLTDAPGGLKEVLQTLMPLVRSAANLIYNKSHVPAIVSISRTDTGGLGAAAHTLLKEISTKAPDVFRVHVNELCETLKNQTPNGSSQGDAGVLDTLKACASFARRFPDDVPKDRDLYKAMAAFASHGHPPKTAKHAVTVIVSSADKKEMYIRQIEDACVNGFEYGGDGFLAKLAAISQLKLLASKECEGASEQMTAIAIEQVLTQARRRSHGDDPDWQDDIDDDLAAKLWALRILVNDLRGLTQGDEEVVDDQQVKVTAARVYQLLNTLIDRKGELGQDNDTPTHHRAHLRLAAAVHILKLSRNRTCDQLFTIADFNRLCNIAQDQIPQVRAGFLAALRKYMSGNLLPVRFYTIPFLYAFEPDKDTKDSAVSWLRARAATHARAGDGVMETTFARFLSLLAHHPDFSTDPGDLHDFVEYILFYLKIVATQTNLPAIYHFAQRLKSVQDGINASQSENLYVLSDLAEAVIRQFQDVQGWSLQLSAGKLGLPSGIFARLPSHRAAQDIADKRFLPVELAEELEGLVKSLMKAKKRRHDGAAAASGSAAKKARTANRGTKAPVRKAESKAAGKAAAKTPKKRAADPVPSSERRKSSRVSGVRNYAESDDSEVENGVDNDEGDIEMADEADEAEGDSGNENIEQEVVAIDSSPPASVSQPSPLPTRKGKKPMANGKTARAPPAPSKRPTRSGRTRAAAKTDADVMDVPSDSE